VRAALSAAGIPPELLTLEITEGGVMSDPDRALLVLQELHEHGVALSIDDFGTGYSSLAYLLHLPVDEVKIDKSFVLTLATSPRNTDMVRAIVDSGTRSGCASSPKGWRTCGARRSSRRCTAMSRRAISSAGRSPRPS
jgi:EAL domain-containing protein (putative c-di-GMP-specific phosphodiesterase class I)